MTINRRGFLRGAGCLVAAGAVTWTAETPSYASEESESNTIVGPRKGYAPQIGTLVSMMGFMRLQVMASTRDLKPAELDWLLDGKANTIGALMLHLAATETFYQLHTFDGIPWGKFPEAVEKQWHAASELGDQGRAQIKGHDLAYYYDALKTTREKTLAEFRKRDDKWLFAVDKSWPWGPTNNYCKWFHVCEHEANHNGQIKLLKGRLPGPKPNGGG